MAFRLRINYLESSGPSGTNLEYLLSLRDALEVEGNADDYVQALATLVESEKELI